VQACGSTSICKGIRKLSSSIAEGKEPVGGPGGLFTSLFSTDELISLTSDAAWVQAMLDTESALAISLAEVGIIPASAATEIAARCRADGFDAVELGRLARSSGNPVVPLVAALRGEVGQLAAQWVHWGATSQDILDTAAVLVSRSATAAIDRSLRDLADGCAALAQAHRHTLMTARTLLQPALPTTFGRKAAGWLVATDGARDQMAHAAAGLAMQLGGAAGTLASLGADGPAVITRLAGHLGLAEPIVPWHTDRQRFTTLGSALAGATGVAAKITYDIALLMQDEVGEVRASAVPGRGGSSALPQKHNPVDAAIVGGAARRVPALVAVLYSAMAHEHERGIGNWHVEWETLTELLRLSGGAVTTGAERVSELRIDPDAMARNLASSGGVILAERVLAELTRRAGRDEAQRLVTAAMDRYATSGSSFEAELRDKEVAKWVSPDEVDALLDPAAYLGSSGIFIDRALFAHEQREE
jgi:3-carboxy-cis,cis-muconate cycloisomerase